MSSHKLKNTSSGQPVRNEASNFLSTFSPAQIHYGTIFSSANMAHSLEESGLNDLAHIDKRSAHNALERQRRENLNTKYQQLAHALPSLQTVRRPSKTVIVAKSLEFVNLSIDQESKFKKKIHYLRQENDRLRDEAQLRAKQQGRKLSIKTAKAAPAPSPTPSSCSASFAKPLYLSPEKLVLKTEQVKEEAAAAAAAATLSPPMQTPTPSAGTTSPDASTTATPTTPALTTPVNTTKRLPSSTSMGSTNTSSDYSYSSSSTLTVNTSVKRRKSADEADPTAAAAAKKRNRHSTSSPATTIGAVDTVSNGSVNNDFLAAYTSSSSMPHLTPTPHEFALSDQEVYHPDLTSPFVNHQSSISSGYYPHPFSASAVMIPRNPPLTSVSHHHNHHHYRAAAAAAAAMQAAATATMGVQQQQHHLVAPFPTSMSGGDDRAMMPPFQPAVLDMSSSFSTPPPSSYMPNVAYHPVIYPSPYPQPDPSAMDYLW